MKCSDLQLRFKNKLLWLFFKGTPPSNEDPEGPYPTIITQESGAEVLVLQAYTFGKYLGYSEITFDDDGKVLLYEGNPILLNSSFPEGMYIIANLMNKCSFRAHSQPLQYQVTANISHVHSSFQ